MARDTDTSTNARLRSRSPDRSTSYRHRSRSPHSSHRHHHSSHHRSDKTDTRKRKRTSPGAEDPNTTLIPSSAVPPRPVVLSYNAKPLSKHDFKTYKLLFASYLDIQKNLLLEELEERETRGRWKSFVAKWNKGELAAGWYEPETLRKAVRAAEEEEVEREADKAEEIERRRGADDSHAEESRYMGARTEEAGSNDDSESADDDIGPTPAQAITVHGTRKGAAIPTCDDLALRDEQAADEASTSLATHRAARKQERTLAQSRLDELAPRAEAGTRDRQLEKRKEVAASNRSFADARGVGDGMEDVAEDVAMGGDAGGGGGIKEMKARDQRKKNEREVRREEILRARVAEREERLVGMRAKENRTMEMLKGLAKQRFG